MISSPVVRLRHLVEWVAALAVLTVSIALPVAAQPGAGPPATPVRFTETLSHPVRQDLRLTGTVESRVEALVASEIEGLVEIMIANEGDEVKAGDTLCRLRTADLELVLKATEASRAEALARLQRAEHVLGRARGLREQSLVADDELDEALQEYNARQARVRQLDAELERIRLDLERSSILAPMDGTVVGRMTEIGEWLRVGDGVAWMISLDDLEVTVSVPETKFPMVRLGDAATVTFDALPGERMNATVRARIPRATERSRTFPIKVKLDNPEHRIAVGMLARVALYVGEQTDGVLVPKDALVTRGSDRSVYVISPENTVAPVSVVTGLAIGDWIAVGGDIAPGQRVVTRGNERLRPGQAVTGEPMEYPLP